MNLDNKIRIWADGACSGNPGRGGIGIIMRWRDKERVISYGYKHTTNNRMELLSVIVALEAITTKKYDIEVYSDSKYVVDSVENGWVFGWEKVNFKNRPNADLWRRFLALYRQFNIKFIWVKGHADNEFNNRCDKLAVNSYSMNNSINFKDDL